MWRRFERYQSLHSTKGSIPIFKLILKMALSAPTACHQIAAKSKFLAIVNLSHGGLEFLLCLQEQLHITRWLTLCRSTQDL